MKRILALLGLLTLLLFGVGAAVALNPGEHVACATASATAAGVTVPGHSIGVDGAEVKSIAGVTTPGSNNVQTACVTATDQTVTVTVNGTTSVTSTTVPTTQPTTTTTPPPPSASWPANPYPSGSVYNPGAPIPSNVSVDPNSAAIVSYWQAHATGGYKFTDASWAVGLTQSHASDPCYNIQSSGNPGRFGCVHIPLGAQPALPTPANGGDAHLDVLDYANGHEISMYRASFSGGVWSASCTQVLTFAEKNTKDASVSPGDCGDTAGMPLSAGLVAPEEIAAGHIDHPLSMFAPHLFEQSYGVGYRCPAGFIGSGSGGTDANAPRAGMWFQLDPSVDVSALAIPAWQKTLLVALQKYGAFVRDQSGTDTGFYGEVMNGNRAGAWPQGSGNQVLSSAIPWNRMRVLTAPC